jgi:hypothetical protein
MKQLILNLKTVLFVCLMGMSTGTFANRPSDILDSEGDLRNQIVKLIEKPDLTNTAFNKEEALLHFMVNVKGEIVVLFVETENTFVDQYLKERLNYRRLKEVHSGRYRLKVTIKNGNEIGK